MFNLTDVMTSKSRAAGRGVPPPYAISLLCVVGLAACHGGGSTPKNTQVVATVNDREITVTQLNQVLQSTNAEAVTPDVTKEAIESLIREELLVQDALKHKLDRDPAVVQAIERTRRQVLARSFAERNLYPRGAIKASEIESYYKKNPLLFEHRKKFRFTTFLLDKQNLIPELQGEIDQAHSVDEVRNALDKQMVRYEVRTASFTADQLPVNKLSELEHAAVGDVMVADQRNDKILLMAVAAIENDEPISMESAKPIIERYLINLRNEEALDTYLTGAKAAANVAYVRDVKPVTRDDSVAVAGGGTDAKDNFRSGITGLK